MPSTVVTMKLSYDILFLIAQQLPDKERFYLCIANKTFYGMAYKCFLREHIFDAMRQPFPENALFAAMKDDSVTRLGLILDYLKFDSIEDAYSKWGSSLVGGLHDSTLAHFWRVMTEYCVCEGAVKCFRILADEVSWVPQAVLSLGWDIVHDAVYADVPELVAPVFNIVRLGPNSNLEDFNLNLQIATATSTRMVHALFQIGDEYFPAHNEGLDWMGNPFRGGRYNFDRILCMTQSAEIAATIFEYAQTYLPAEHDWGEAGCHQCGGYSHHEALFAHCLPSLIRTLVEHGYPHDNILNNELRFPLDEAARNLDHDAVLCLLELGAHFGGSFDYHLKSDGFVVPTTPLEYMMTPEAEYPFELQSLHLSFLPSDYIIVVNEYEDWLCRVEDFYNRMVPIAKLLLDAGTVEFIKERRRDYKDICQGYDVLGRFVKLATAHITESRQFWKQHMQCWKKHGFTETGTCSSGLQVIRNADGMEIPDIDATEDPYEAGNFELLGVMCDLLVDAGAGWTKRSVRMLEEVTHGSTGIKRLLDLVAVQVARGNRFTDMVLLNSMESTEQEHADLYVWDDDDGYWVEA
jgi:hypothetical protein